MKLITYHHYKSDPYFNMAFDEWMLQKVIKTNSLICLRLYSWSVGTITFGFNQQLQKAYNNNKTDNTPVIRRVTGGRGLFHDESELTYSIAVSSDLLDDGTLSQSISKASSEIANILIQFLEQLDIPSDYVRHSSKSEKDKDFFHKAPCFASFSKNEIVSNKQKIIASAQRRVNGALLQHGSIKINGIKHHDALPLEFVKPMELSEMGELTHLDFNYYLPLFITSFSNYFSVKHIQGVITKDEKKHLEKREKMVLENSLKKRNIFKQSE